MLTVVPTELHTRLITLLPITLGAFCLGATQNLFAPNLTLIANTFHISENNRDLYLGGYLSTAYYTVGAPASLIFGILVDKIPRKQMMIILLSIGAITIILTGLATSIYEIIFYRCILGAINGGINPLLYSLIGDLYLPWERSSIASYSGLMVSAGTIIGQLMAGLLINYGWRLPFFVISSLCVIMIIVINRYSYEPVRGLADTLVLNVTNNTSHGLYPDNDNMNTNLNPSKTGLGNTNYSSSGNSSSSNHNNTNNGSLLGSGSNSSTNSSSYSLVTGTTTTSSFSFSQLLLLIRISLTATLPRVQKILTVPTNKYLYTQGIFGTIPWAVITVFLTDYLTQNKHFTTPHATLLVILFGIGAIIGGVMGGTLGKYIYSNYGSSTVPLVFGSIQALSSIPMIFILSMSPLPSPLKDASSSSLSSVVVVGGVSHYDLLPIYGTVILAGVLASATGPNLKAMLLNVNIPDTRGLTFTIGYITDSISKGLAPYFIGLWISILGIEQRSFIFHLAMIAWPLSGLIILLTTYTTHNDELIVQRNIKEITKGSQQ